MALTPLLLMAGQGLMDNSALQVNPAWQAELSTYLAQSVISKFKLSANALQNDLYDGGTNPYGVPQSTIDSFVHVMDGLMPALTDVIPTGSSITTTFLSDFIDNHIVNLMDGDNSRFIAFLQSAQGAVYIANQFINSAVNGASVASHTFTSMDSLMSGNITSVTKYTPAFADDIQKSGNLHNFARLSVFGTPQYLVERLIATNVLGLTADALAEQGIDMFELQEEVTRYPTVKLATIKQKKCYTAFTNITGEQLDTILFVIGIQHSVETLADLLNPVLMFPTSFQTITAPTTGVLTNIYTDAQGTIASFVSSVVTDTVLAMPSDIAKAGYMLGVSLQQIKGIHKATPAALAAQAANLETSLGLTDIVALTQALPGDVAPFYQATIGGGNGPNDTFYLTDALGSPAGIPHLTNFTIINDNIAAWSTSGDLDLIESICVVARLVAIGAYSTGNLSFPEELEIPVGEPAAGIYNNKTQAMAALQIVLEAEVAVLTGAYPTEVAAVNAAYQASIDHILLELATLQTANITFAITYTSFDTVDAFAPPGSTQTTLGFIETLHSAGALTDKGNVAEILEKMVTTSRGGQAVIAAMREGRNLKRLSDANIINDTEISSDPAVSEPGDILPSSY